MKKALALLLAATMLLTFAGCSGSGQTVTTTAASQATTTAAVAAAGATTTAAKTTAATTAAAATTTAAATTATGAALPDDKFAGYPMDFSDETLVLYNASNGMALNAAYTEFSESPWHSGVSERVGVNIEWRAPAAGADRNQALSLLLASGDLPDMIYAGDLAANAGDYINDDYIVVLNDYLPQWAPSLNAFLEKNPDYARAIRTDKGEYYCFPFFREDLWLGTYEGPMIRQDLLDQAGKDIPVTIADWDDVLHSFVGLVEIPFGTWGGTVFNEVFTNAYGFRLDYFVGGDGQAQYGYAVKSYADFLALIKKWYADGIIDPDFATNDRPGLKTKVLQSLVGATRTSGGTLSGYLKEMETLGVKDVWTATQYPVMNEGDTVNFVQGETYFIGLGGVITTACKNVELACRVYDYFFTDEGIEYMNFGAEGNIMEHDADGKPHFTQAALNDPEGFNTILGRYQGNSANGIGFMLVDMYRQKTAEVACDAIDTWYYGANHDSRWPATTPNSAEQSATASAITQIQTYCGEMYYKFIMGEEPLENFDAYLEQLNALGLQDVLAIKTAQLQRYNNR